MFGLRLGTPPCNAGKCQPNTAKIHQSSPCFRVKSTSSSETKVRLANEGATEHQLMAWFGWTSIREAERYTRKANRKRLAESAGKLISGTSSGKPATQFAKKSISH
jgi:hypothetical protein